MVGVTPSNIGSAQRINQNPNLSSAQQVQSSNNSKIQKYVDERLAEGFVQNPDGSLSRTVGSSTTVITIDRSTGVVNSKTTTETPAQSTQVETDELKQLEKEQNKVLKAIKSAGSSRTRDQLIERAKQLTEAINNLKNTGSAFYTVSTPGSSNTVFDSKGLGYSVAPEKQEEFLSKKEQSYVREASLLTPSIPASSSTSSSSFTVPRTVNASESRTPDQISQFMIDQQNQPIADLQSLDQKNLATQKKAFQEGKFGLGVGVSAVILGEGVARGMLSAPLILSPVKPSGEFQVPVVQPTLEFGKYLVTGEYIPDLLKNPVGFVGEGVGSFLVLSSTPLKNVASKEVQIMSLPLQKGKQVLVDSQFVKSDVQASAYDLSRSSEKAQVFLKDNKISPNTVGSPEFNPIPQLTVPISEFNKNQKYFGEPSVDVPFDRQFTLAGTEKVPPKNKPGVLPLVEQTVTPFESNPLMIEQIGKKPLLEVNSYAQSRMVDLPVSKGSNKPEVLGRFVADNPKGDSVTVSGSSQPSTIQSDLNNFGSKFELNQLGFRNPIADKVSSVPKGSNKPLVYEKVTAPVERSLPDNSNAYADTGLLTESVSSISDYPSRTFGSEKRLSLSSDYVLDSNTGEYVKRVADVEFNLDVKGKVSPQKFGSSPVLILGSSPQSLTDSTSKNDLKLSPSLDQGSKISPLLRDDQSIKPKTELKYLDLSKTDIQQIPATKQESSLMSRISLDQLKKSPGSELTSLKEKGSKFKALTPLKTADRQKPSGFGSFSVLVRKEGKFVKIGSGYSDLATAFNRGKQEVKDTARASFKVVNSFGGAEKFNLSNERTLRSSKVDSSVVVQKNTFRISSSGEKNEISAKGRSSQNTRRLLKKNNKGIFG